MNRSKFCKECPHRFLCEVLKLYKDCPNKGSSLCSSISDIDRKSFKMPNRYLAKNISFKDPICDLEENDLISQFVISRCIPTYNK